MKIQFVLLFSLLSSCATSKQSVDEIYLAKVARVADSFSDWKSSEDLNAILDSINMKVLYHGVDSYSLRENGIDAKIYFGKEMKVILGIKNPEWCAVHLLDVLRLIPANKWSRYKGPPRWKRPSHTSSASRFSGVGYRAGLFVRYYHINGAQCVSSVIFSK